MVPPNMRNDKIFLHEKNIVKRDSLYNSYMTQAMHSKINDKDSIKINFYALIRKRNNHKKSIASNFWV